MKSANTARRKNNYHIGQKQINEIAYSQKQHITNVSLIVLKLLEGEADLITVHFMNLIVLLFFIIFVFQRQH